MHISPLTHPLVLLLLSPLPHLTTALPSFNAPRQTPALEEETDRLIFTTSMSEFQSARSAQSPPELDWTSNGCTASPDNPLGFDFLASCQRHDFGYRNYKAQDRFTEPARETIDDNFRDDMYAQCASEGGLEGVCRGVADLYYEAVRAFGSKKRGVEIEVAGWEIRE
ncbi:uncharacterized protein HMPREF1541_09433 [Cyphellophora europaea CBS 101466]|uniref:Phospholipase A2 n=1 Tax=Cyphellophora europaea (strain CBS 101466) TaxID=1220924 RepID=W2SA40_CYPE1|nr:uncharacterized protein HMPREF1541_09433 [Cyphellophora europaea CBS 101466]ETN45601.1 hypothetical protein HMPREF1541_09433 [Cyphellophora europaea CBS 101466]